MAQKCGPLEVDPQALYAVLQQIRPFDPRKYAAQLEKPIMTDEVIRALRAGARRKTPGIGGINLEFYIEHWKTLQTDLTQLLNDMFLNKHITANQKQGILLCLPKSQNSLIPDACLPISLLNTEYKLLARIMAQRFKPILAEQMSSGQYCGIPGRIIKDALATVRDVIAYHKTIRTPLCLLSRDFDKHLTVYHTTTCSKCCDSTESARGSWKDCTPCMTTSMRRCK